MENKINIIRNIFNSPKLWLWLIIVFYIIISSIYAIACLVNHSQYRTLGDLAIFTNGIWQYSQFKFPFINFHLNRYWLGDHFHPILVLLAPFFWIFSSEKTLLVLQPFIMLSAIIPLFLITKKLTKSNFLGFSLSIAYGLYLPLQRTLFFDFHEIIIAPPLIAWIYYFYLSKNIRRYFISLLLLLLVKEEMGFLIGTFGFYIFVSDKKWRKIGLATTLIGPLYSLLIIKYIIPFIGGDYMYQNYGKMGNGPMEVLLNVLKNPLLLIEIFTSSQLKIETIKETFAPYGYLPLFNMWGLLLSFEQLFSRFADYGTLNRWRNDLHYAAPMTIIVAISTVISVSLFTKRINKYQKHFYIFIALFILLLTRLEQINKSAILLIKRPQFWERSDWMRYNDEAIILVPQDASIATQANIISRFAARNEFYGLSQKEKATYILVDLRQDQSSVNYLEKYFNDNDWQELKNELLEKVGSGNLEIVYNKGETYLFKKTDI